MRPRHLPLLLFLLLFPVLASGQTTLSDRTATGALTAAWNGSGTQPANTAVLVSLPSQNGVAVQLTGTFVGTVQFEALVDQPRATWLALNGTPFAGGSSVSSATATGAWIFNVSGVKVFRVRCSAFTSGTIQVGVVASAANPPPTVSLSGSVSISQLPSSAALADATANPTTTGIADYNFIYNGTSWDRLRDSTGATNGTAGTLASGLMVFDTVDAQNKRVNSIASSISGGLNGKNVAAVGTVQMAVAHGAAPTYYASGGYTHRLGDRAGVPYVIGGHPDVKTFSQNYTSAQTDTAVVTISTGSKIVVTSCLVKAANSNTVDVSARLGFGTANTPAYGNNGLLLTDPGIAHGSGIGRGSGAGIVGVGADDEDLRFTCSVPTGGSVDCTITYYTIPS